MKGFPQIMEKAVGTQVTDIYGAHGVSRNGQNGNIYEDEGGISVAR